MPGHRLTQWNLLTLTVTSVKAVDLPGNLTYVNISKDMNYRSGSVIARGAFHTAVQPSWFKQMVPIPLLSAISFIECVYHVYLVSCLEKIWLIML